MKGIRKCRVNNLREKGVTQRRDELKVRCSKKLEIEKGMRKLGRERHGERETTRENKKIE